MIDIIKSRRLLLRGIFGSACMVSILQGCASDNNNNIIAVEKLTSTLRHQGVAAHLGRLEVEAKPELQSMTQAQLVANILKSINLDIDAVANANADSIDERLSLKIRQDFSDESVTTVDGWLLSVTEAKICALVYLQITQTSA